MESKQYHVQDRSILLGPMKRWIFTPLLAFIPERTSANTLTLLGTAMSAASFAMALLLPPTPGVVLAVGLLLLGYVLLDNLDGAQARRTGTGSPLGEFLDHWLDSLNNVFVYMGGAALLGLDPERAVIILALGTTSYSLAFWEQRITGRMSMTWFGNLEGLVIIGLFYLVAAALGPTLVFTYPVAFGYTVTDVLVVTCVVVTLGNCVGPLWRVRHRLSEVVVVLAPVVAVVLWYFEGAVPGMTACGLLMLMSPALAGRMLISRIHSRQDLGPDRVLIGGSIALSVVCVLAPVHPNVQATLMSVLLMYAILQVGLDFILTVRSLGAYVRPGELLSVGVRIRRD
jgi:phosphatidylglycerophosphate synthase